MILDLLIRPSRFFREHEPTVLQSIAIFMSAWVLGTIISIFVYLDPLLPDSLSGIPQLLGFTLLWFPGGPDRLPSLLLLIWIYLIGYIICTVLVALYWKWVTRRSFSAAYARYLAAVSPAMLLHPGLGGIGFIWGFSLLMIDARIAGRHAPLKSLGALLLTIGIATATFYSTIAFMAAGL